MAMIQVPVNEKGEATLTCPQCGTIQRRRLAQYHNLHRPLKVKCGCGCLFTIVPQWTEHAGARREGGQGTRSGVQEGQINVHQVMAQGQQLVGLLGVMMLLIAVWLHFLSFAAYRLGGAFQVFLFKTAGYACVVAAVLAVVLMRKKAYRYLRAVGIAVSLLPLIPMFSQPGFFKVEVSFLDLSYRGDLDHWYQWVWLVWIAGGACIWAAGREGPWSDGSATWLPKYLASRDRSDSWKELRNQDDASEGWCPIHQCQMQLHTQAGQFWWSHHVDAGEECHGV